MSDIPSWAGTLPGWITAIVSTGGFAAWLKYLNDKRKLEGTRLVDLEKENRTLRKDFDEYRKACIADNDKLHALVQGLRTQMTQLQLRELERTANGEAPATVTRFLGDGR